MVLCQVTSHNFHMIPPFPVPRGAAFYLEAGGSTRHMEQRVIIFRKNVILLPTSGRT
jgi:hypothetical protein